MVSFSGRHGTASCLYRSDQPAVQRDFSAAALFVCGRAHAYFLAEFGELFQPGDFPGMRACSSQATFRRRWRRFRLCYRAAALNPFTPIGGLDNTWVQGRRATRFFINDNLAWSHGAHELRFGTNTRIFRLNDFDFGEGTVPTVTYANLQQFIYGVANTASQTFPQMRTSLSTFSISISMRKTRGR